MQFGKALSYTVAGKTIYVALSFFINLLMVRLLGAAESGQFFYTVAILSFITLLLSFCLDAGITYYASRQRQVIPSLVIIIFPVLIIEGLLCWLILHFLDLEINNFIALLFVMGNISTYYFSAFFYAANRYSALIIIQCLIHFILLLLLLYAKKYAIAEDLITMAYMSVYIVQAILLLIFLFAKKAEVAQKNTVNFSLIKQIVQYSLVVFIGNLLFFLVTRIDYYFVDKFCSAVALSNYIQVSRMGQMFILLPTMMAAVIFPYSSGNAEEGFVDKVQFLCRMLTGFFIIAVIFILLTGKWLFPWLFGVEFNSMYIAMLLYLPGFFALSILAVIAAYLAGKKKIIYNLVANIIALLLVIGLDLLLIPALGINGAAIASSTAYCTATLYTLYVYQKIMHCSIADFFLIRKSDLQLVKNLINK